MPVLTVGRFPPLVVVDRPKLHFSYLPVKTIGGEKYELYALTERAKITGSEERTQVGEALVAAVDAKQGAAEGRRRSGGALQQLVVGLAEEPVGAQRELLARHQLAQTGLAPEAVQVVDERAAHAHHIVHRLHRLPALGALAAEQPERPRALARFGVANSNTQLTYETKPIYRLLINIGSRFLYAYVDDLIYTDTIYRIHVFWKTI